MASEYIFDVKPKDPDLAEKSDIPTCNGYTLPSFAVKFLKEQATNYEARADDVYVVSYPKTGTTWTQEIVYLLHTDLDFAGKANKSLVERFPYVEHSMTDINYVKNLTSPRLIKSHFPYTLLPQEIIDKKCKMIYVTRNPKDVVVSYYHFASFLKETQYGGTFDQFFERFIQNRPTYSPFLTHNLDFWEKRNEENILFLFYEDLHKNVTETVNDIAKFLGKKFSDEDISKVIESCSFKNMAKPKDADSDFSSKFFRKGRIGDWQNYLSEEQSKRIDAMVDEVLGNSGLKFTYC